MDEDIERPLGSIHNRIPGSIIDNILEIQKHHTIANDKSLAFTTKLKCYHLTKASRKRRRIGSVRTLKLVHRNAIFQKYIAVSYPCHPAENEREVHQKYRIWPKNNNVPVRDVVMDRCLRYARYRAMCDGQRLEEYPIWIDQLSVVQNGPQKEVGMQAMDIVYRKCTYAVGYLWLKVESQENLDLLGMLLCGHIVSDQLSPPVLQRHVTEDMAKKMRILLLAITEDPWWTRAWIFQEDYNSGPKMQLIIRHAKGLQPLKFRSVFGSLRGELIVSSTNFRKFATMFCIAYQELSYCSPSTRRQCERILEAAGKYNIIVEHCGSSYTQTCETITPRVLRDIGARKITEKPDLLPIAANCLDYTRRIDTTTSKETDRSLSLCILALCLLNGHILLSQSSPEEDRDSTILNFLERRSLPIDVPTLDKEITFMKHCRFNVDRLSPTGIHVKGLLWKLVHKIKLRGKIPSRNHTYWEHRNACLTTLVEYLKNWPIAEKLRYYVQKTSNLEGYDPYSVDHYMDIMSRRIVNAIDTGQPLRLGLIADNTGLAEGSYQGIFVGDFSEAQSPYVFTQWTCAKQHIIDLSSIREPAKYVSLEVYRTKPLGKQCRELKIKQWVNGLCFFEGEPKDEFVFPFPKVFTSKNTATKNTQRYTASLV